MFSPDEFVSAVSRMENDAVLFCAFGEWDFSHRNGICQHHEVDAGISGLRVWAYSEQMCKSTFAKTGRILGHSLVTK